MVVRHLEAWKLVDVKTHRFRTSGKVCTKVKHSGASANLKYGRCGKVGRLVAIAVQPGETH